MKVSNILKKAVAIGASSVMLGATVMGALALDLSDYPKPFVTDGVFAGKIVVGARAMPEDVVSAIDIAAALQAESIEEVPVEVETSSVSVSGGELLTQDLGTCLTGRTYDDRQLDGLFDGTIRFDGKNVKAEEKIVVASSKVCVHNSENNKYYGAEPYLVIADLDALEYKYVFESGKIAIADIDDDAKLTIKLLGTSITITELTDTTFDYIASSERYLEEGESIELDGHTVSLDRVSSEGVRVTVDGQTKTIGDGNEATFDQADDYKVEVKDGSIFFLEGADDNSATLKLGNEISDTAEEGEPLEFFGEPSKASDAEWFWGDFEVDGTDLDYISIVHKKVREDLDDSKGFVPFAVGQALDFPNDYASVEIANLKNAADMAEIKIYMKDTTLNGSNSPDRESVVIFESEDDDELFWVSGDTKASKVYVQLEGAEFRLWYEDDEGDIYHVDGRDNKTFNLTVDNDPFVITPSVYDEAKWKIQDTNTIDKIEFEVNVASGAYTWFGGTEKDADGEIYYADADIAGYDDPFLTDYGVIIRGASASSGPEDAMDADVLYLDVPAEQVKAEVVLKGPRTSVSASADATSYQVNPIAVGMALLDRDAPTLGSTPLLVVGGPAVNTVAAELMGNPTPEEIETIFSDGKAMIKFYSDKNAILVAGWDAEATMGASYVLADYKEYDLTGTEVEIVVPSLTSITVNPVE